MKYIVYMKPIYFTDVEDAFYLDSGLTYDSTPTTTISGVDHLEGETVQVLADGSAHLLRLVKLNFLTLYKLFLPWQTC